MHDPGKVEMIVSFHCFRANGLKREAAVLLCDGKRERWRTLRNPHGNSSANSAQLVIVLCKEMEESRFYRMVMRGLLKNVVPDVDFFFFIFFFFLFRLVAEQILHHLMPLLFSAHLSRALPHTHSTLALPRSPSLSLKTLSLSIFSERRTFSVFRQSRE